MYQYNNIDVIFAYKSGEIEPIHVVATGSVDGATCTCIVPEIEVPKAGVEMIIKISYDYETYSQEFNYTIKI